MRKIIWEELLWAERFIEECAFLAKNATCTRSKCWAIIVSWKDIIWRWFNSPAAWKESQRRCSNDKKEYNSKITDKTCCVHAEQRAIIDTINKNPEKIKWSMLYFVRLDDNWKPKPSWKPYCTICSKMALDVWLKEFVLLHEDWIFAYETWEYNNLSYKYED